MEHNYQDQPKIHRRKRTRVGWPAFLALAGIMLLAVASLLFGRDPVTSNNSDNVTGEPMLHVDQELVDFGEVKFQQPVSATFTLTNNGGETLIFSQEPYIKVLEGC